MPRGIIPQSEAAEAPNEGPAVAAAVAAVALRVAQCEVSCILHAAVLSCNQIRASKRIQGVFRRVSNRHAMEASVLTSDHAAPTNKPCVSPPTFVAAPTERDVELQFAAARATIPSIAAASADVNRTAPSTLPIQASWKYHRLTSPAHQYLVQLRG